MLGQTYNVLIHSYFTQGGTNAYRKENKHNKQTVVPARDYDLCHSVFSLFTQEAAALLLYANKWERESGAVGKRDWDHMRNGIKDVEQRRDGFALMTMHRELCQIWTRRPCIKMDRILSNLQSGPIKGSQQNECQESKTVFQLVFQLPYTVGTTVYVTERQIWEDSWMSACELDWLTHVFLLKYNFIITVLHFHAWALNGSFLYPFSKRLCCDRRGRGNEKSAGQSIKKKKKKRREEIDQESKSL